VESESDDSEVELDEELVSLKKELEKVIKKRREQKMKEKKDKIRKEIVLSLISPKPLHPFHLNQQPPVFLTLLTSTPKKFTL
jgi:hypothetical protein